IWLPEFVTAGAAITLATFIAAQVVKLPIIADLLGLIFRSLKHPRQSCLAALLRASCASTLLFSSGKSLNRSRPDPCIAPTGQLPLRNPNVNLLRLLRRFHFGGGRRCANSTSWLANV